MRRLLITILVLLTIHSAYGQDRKLRKVKELLVEKKNSEADEIIKELTDKYPTLPTVLYYSSLVDLQLNRSLDSIYEKIKFGKKNLSNLRYVNNNSDSVELGFTKEEFQRFKVEIEGLAFDRYYKNSKKIDSLQLFIANFDVSNTQRSYIENRICEISARFALTSVDVSVLRDFINNHKNCVELKLVESRLLVLNWQSAKKFNTYKSYEMFAQQNPSSIFGDSIKMAIEILDWEKTQFNDSISSYESFMLKYPSSKFNNIASNKVDTLQWLPISTSGTLRELHDFVTRYPQSQFNKQAKDSIVKLEWFSIALTNDIETLNRFLEKYPNSNYEIQARNRQDELLWGNCNKPILLELKLYVDKCVLCGHKDEALEKISVLEWNSVKNTNDTNSLNLFIKTYPKSSKINDAKFENEELINKSSYIETRKIFGIQERDSIENEEYWIKKAINKKVVVDMTDRQKPVLIIDGVQFESDLAINKDGDGNTIGVDPDHYLDYEYAGYSKILESHVISVLQYEFQYYMLVNNSYPKGISVDDIIKGQIEQIRAEQFYGALKIQDIVLDKNKTIKWIIAPSEPGGLYGFIVLKTIIGSAIFSSHSEYFNFEKFGQNLDSVKFLNANQIRYSGYQQDKIFSGYFNYNSKINQWQVLKK